MAEDPIGGVLFIRKLPTALSSTSKWRDWFRSCTNSRGASLNVHGHQVIFFFPGSGRMIRDLHPSLIEKMDSGQITDIVDVGAGGGLNPCLRRGDLVLSVGDMPSGLAQAIAVMRRPSAEIAAQATAVRLGRRLLHGRILTHDRIVIGRRARIDIFERTGCDVVQMEHCWFLDRLLERLTRESMDRIYVTHLEVIADEVPSTDSLLGSAKELFDGVGGCILRNQHFLGPVKSEFLKSWLAAAGGT